MDTNNTKEKLSISYINAVAAMIGADYTIDPNDKTGVDGIVKKRITASNGKEIQSSFNVQLKTTASDNLVQITPDSIKYSLKAKAHRDLCTESNVPLYLCLLVLQGDESDWLKWSEAELLINGCMYWQSFEGQTATDNKESVNITIPKTQVLNPEGIQFLLEKALGS
jgi:hypothetical protein